jgi:hypothetical protein
MNRTFTSLALAAVTACCSGCLTQKALQEAKGKSLSFTAYALPTFTNTDILDPDGLARKLQARTDLVSDFLDATMQPSNRTRIEEAIGANQDSNQLRSSLVIALNDVLRQPSIYDAKRFEKIALRPQTEKLRETDPQGYKLWRLNRLLLEDAYPSELSRMPPPRFYVPAAYVRVPFAVMGDVVLLPGYIIVAPVFVYYGVLFEIYGPGC